MVEAFGIDAFYTGPRRLRAYYSPAMEAARPRRRRQRPRRGTMDRPVNARLVRVSALLVAPALLALLFSVSATGTLPRPTLDPLFDAETAASLATRFSSENPSRVPGTFTAQTAAHWFDETISGFGFTTEQDVWSEEVPGLGRVELRNIIAVVPGRAEDAIVVVAHRDNAGAGVPYGDNASGTATLVELARGFAPRGATNPPRPARTLVLVSTDAGAYGGAGAARFVERSPYADRTVAAVVLDGIGGRGRPRIAIAGDKPRSPAPALVTTAAARIREQTGLEPELPGVATQLVDLAVPYAAGEQGRFLAHGIAAITLTTQERDEPPIPHGDAAGAVSAARLGAMGRSAEALLGSIDQSVGAAFRTPDSIFVGDRVASGWALRLTLLVAVVPFALGAVDLLVRARRRGLPLVPALRSLRTRLFFWIYAGVLVWVAGVAGILPTGAALPPPPYSSAVADWPLAGLGLVAIALLGGWLVERRRLVPGVAGTGEERLAGYSVALAWLAGVSVVAGLAAPYVLVFVLPSLYSWLWLPTCTRAWTRALVYALGLLGPIAGLVLLGSQLGLGLLDTALYVLDLFSLGYVPFTATVLAIAWAAAAGQLAALAASRYAPYAGGLEPPPPGPVRTAARELAGRARGRSYARAR
jgi:hypothetical protein